MTQDSQSFDPIEQTQPAQINPVGLQPDAINGIVQFRGMYGDVRRITRHGQRLLNEATVYCSRLVDQWFKYIAANPDDFEGQGAELVRLDKAWHTWLRLRCAKYVFEKCSSLFSEKMMFLIGNKKTNEELLSKLNNSEKNLE